MNHSEQLHIQSMSIIIHIIMGILGFFSWFGPDPVTVTLSLKPVPNLHDLFMVPPQTVLNVLEVVTGWQ